MCALVTGVQTCALPIYEVLHVDFLQLFDDKLVKMDVPVRLTGVSPGVRSGGKLLQNFRKLQVKGYPKDMIDFIAVDISSLEVGDSIRVAAIKLDNLAQIGRAHVCTPVTNAQHVSRTLLEK